MKFRVPLASAVALEILNDIKSGTGANPKLEIYTGSIPASMGNTISDTLLAAFDLGATVGSENNGEVVFSGWSDEPSAPGSGAAGWGRILNKSGEEVIYLNATDSQGAGPIKVNPNEIVAGDPVTLTAATFRLPT